MARNCGTGILPTIFALVFLGLGGGMPPTHPVGYPPAGVVALPHKASSLFGCQPHLEMEMPGARHGVAVRVWPEAREQLHGAVEKRFPERALGLQGGHCSFWAAVEAATLTSLSSWSSCHAWCRIGWEAL